MGRVYVPDNAEFPLTVDVAVIGGGIIGTAAAFFVSRVGLNTVVLEQKKALASLTSAGSSEVFRAQYVLPEHIAQMRASIQMLENFSELIGIPDYDIAIHQPGYVFLTAAPDGPARLRARVEHQHRLGLTDVEVLVAPDLQRAFPWVAPCATAGTYRARDGWFSVWETTYGLAKGSSARFLLETAVSGFITEGARVVGLETNRGAVRARHVILAAGPYSRSLAAMIGISLPITLFQQHEATIHHHDAIPKGAPVVLDLDTGAFWRPEAGGGGMLSTGYHERVEQPMDPVPLDWTYPVMAMEATSRLSPFWLKVAERLKRDNVSVRGGQMSYTPDKKAIIGPYPGIDGLSLSVGYSGHGVMSALGAGKHLAELITGRESDANNPFSMRRFTEGWELTSEEMTFDNLTGSSD